MSTTATAIRPLVADDLYDMNAGQLRNHLTDWVIENGWDDYAHALVNLIAWKAVMDRNQIRADVIADVEALG